LTEATPATPAAEGRLARLAEGLLLAAIVLAPWPYGSSADAPRYALTAVVALAGAAWCAARARAGGGLPALVLPALGLPVFALLQVVLGRSAAPVWTAEAFLVLVAMLAALVAASGRSQDRDAARRIATAVLVACGAQAIFGAVQWSFAPDRIYGRTTPIVTTPFGSFVNHNHFAGLLGMGTVLAAGMALGHARRGGTPTPAAVALGGLSLGLGAAHLASRSRGGLLALVGGLVLLGLLWLVATSRRSATASARWGYAGLAALVVLVFGLAVVPSGTRKHLGSVLSGPRDSSGEYRVDIARATLRLALSRPLLGSGLGAFADAVPPFKQGHGDVRTTHAESDVLELTAEGGLVGLALAAWLASGILAGFADRLRHGRDPFRRGIGVGALAAAGTLAVHSLFDFNLRVPGNALVFCCLAGLAASPRSAQPARLGRRATLAGLFVLLALAGVAAWRAEGAWELDRAMARAEPQLRIAALDRTLARHPALAEGYRARGAALLALARGELATPRLARADADFRRALALRPAWGEAWAELAWVRLLRGDVGGAREAMDRARALDPTHPGIRLWEQALQKHLEAAAGAPPGLPPAGR
jgi:O-antigen ligase